MVRILLVAAALGIFADGPEAPVTAHADVRCSVGPEYYAFELFTTKNIPGTGLAKGHAEINVSGASPFAVSLTNDGSYRYDVSVRLERMRAPREFACCARTDS